MNLRQAKRDAAKIRCALQGPSGSGKTMSALLLAYGLVEDWSKIVIIDTENRSADLYAHLGDYKVLTLEKPFSPMRYIQAIEACENAGMEVIIIDSISHEWQGSGGILEVHGNMQGNSFANWSKITPKHNEFLQKILQSNSHIVATIRTKQDYVLSEKEGKMVPEKVGLKGVTRDDMDYEFTIVFNIDMAHMATSSKDRTGIFSDHAPFVINAATGKRIVDWCSGENGREHLISLINQTDNMEDLRKLYYGNPAYQKDLEDQFLIKKEALLQFQPQNGSHGISFG